MWNRSGRTLVVSLLTLVPALVQAGPPLVCFPIPIADARSLPWGGESHAQRADYDRARLADDTLGLLSPKTPVLVRMETLRRAALYASSDGKAAGQLFAALRARTAELGANADALALFDLGYAVETYRQSLSGSRSSTPPPPLPSEDGYALVRRALALRGSDPEMEYAAALMTLDPGLRGSPDEHLRRALSGAREGSPLALTIAAQRQLWGGRLRGDRASAGR